MKKTLIFAIVLVISVTVILSFRRDDDYVTPPLSNDLNLFASEEHRNYKAYRALFSNVFPDEIIYVDLLDYTYSGGLFEDDIPYFTSFKDDNNITKNGLYTPETGEVTFNVFVNTAGFYQIGIDYFSIVGRSASIQRSVLINNESPFFEAERIIFERFWTDSFSVSAQRQLDISDIRPRQIEKHLWTTSYFSDRMGYYHEAYFFYFESGVNTITLEALREPMVIGSLRLLQKEPLPSYGMYYQKHRENGAQVIENTYIIEAEEAFTKSSPSLKPTAEFSTFKFSPYRRFITTYNAIGGVNWRILGDTITWKVEVGKSGFYKLTFNAMQNFSRGQVVARTLLVNGEIPFKEASLVTFNHDSDLKHRTVGGDKPQYVFLDAGVNKIGLRTTIGAYAEQVRIVNKLVLELRTFFREVTIRTSLNPDPLQDYMLDRHVEDLEKRLLIYEKTLQVLINDVIRISGGRSGLISAFERSQHQIGTFIEDRKNIQIGLRELEQNITALSVWTNEVSQQPLTIDQIIISGHTHEFPRVRANFFERLWQGIVLFIGSFNDQGAFGSGLEVPGPTIEVWVGTGRDQTTILRQLIDESFVTQNGINVDLKMVNMGILLSAVLSGNGPDVALGISQKLPVNWGIRNAIVDLSQFEDHEEVTNWFSESAMTPLRFGDSVYGLPDTEDFLVTFYRNDILEDIGITEIPTTWECVIDISPVLQKKHLEFYIPLAQGTLPTVLFAMIEQRGGDLYTDDGKSSGMLEPNSVNAFLDFTAFFKDYGFALDANFANRFRSGEMPIGIANYTLYNVLSVFAPEIAGKWNFGLLPGTMVDGELNQSTTSSITASVIIEASQEKEASWEFLKWWLSVDTQLNYARDMEAVLGSAGRYPTANLEAFRQLPWPAKDYFILKTQRELAIGIPTVPGDYIVGRHIDNAFRAVINTGISPKDALFHYHLEINQELNRKREELELYD